MCVYIHEYRPVYVSVCVHRVSANCNTFSTVRQAVSWPHPVVNSLVNFPYYSPLLPSLFNLPVCSVLCQIVEVCCAPVLPLLAPDCAIFHHRFVYVFLFVCLHLNKILTFLWIWVFTSYFKQTWQIYTTLSGTPHYSTIVTLVQ